MKGSQNAAFAIGNAPYALSFSPKRIKRPLVFSTIVEGGAAPYDGIVTVRPSRNKQTAHPNDDSVAELGHAALFWVRQEGWPPKKSADGTMGEVYFVSNWGATEHGAYRSEAAMAIPRPRRFL